MRHGEAYAREIEAELSAWPADDSDHWPASGSSEFIAHVAEHVAPFAVPDMDPSAVNEMDSCRRFYPFSDMTSVQLLVADVAVYHSHRTPVEEDYGMRQADFFDFNLYGRPSL